MALPGPPQPENGHLGPGIVHRLDKDTSGVILVAKDDATHRDLAMQFETRKVFKEYVAIAAGELDRDTDYIEGAMKMHPHDRLRMIVSTDADAKPALSYYEVMERFRGFTLVKVQPRTGRTHQIRVHLLHVGCPVLADKLYGGRDPFKLSDVVPGTPKERGRSADRPAGTARLPPAVQAPAKGHLDRGRSPVAARTCGGHWMCCARIGRFDSLFAENLINNCLRHG